MYSVANNNVGSNDVATENNGTELTKCKSTPQTSTTQSVTSPLPNQVDLTDENINVETSLSIPMAKSILTVQN